MGFCKFHYFFGCKALIKKEQRQKRKRTTVFSRKIKSKEISEFTGWLETKKIIKYYFEMRVKFINTALSSQSQFQNFYFLHFLLKLKFGPKLSPKSGNQSQTKLVLHPAVPFIGSWLYRHCHLHLALECAEVTILFSFFFQPVRYKSSHENKKTFSPFYHKKYFW